MNPQTATMPAMPPAMQVMNLGIGYWISRALHVAAELKIADLLKDGPRPVTELAAASGARPDMLYRVLRALASVNVFEETDGNKTFGLTPLSQTMRTDVPNSTHALLVFMGDEWHWKSYGEMKHTVMSGEPAFNYAMGAPVFEYLAKHPEDAKRFDEAMASNSAQSIEAVMQAYDFSPFGTIIDIAGGTGAFLGAALQKAPQARGVLFDLPHVVDRARSAGLLPAGRSEFASGDFFQAVPSGGDAYTLKHIVHDWDDASATRILAACRKAIKPNGKLLLCETVIAPGNAPGLGKMLDLEMMVATTGRERTREEFQSLLAGAGFRLDRVVETASPICVLESSPV